MQSKKIKNSGSIGQLAENPNLRIVGASGEEMSCNYLKSKGYAIVERNFRCPLGELDIVARKGDEYFFVEVKTRFSKAYGTPFDAIDVRKQKKIIAVAKWFMAKQKLGEKICHLSAIGIYASVSPPEIVFIPDAFDTNF